MGSESQKELDTHVYTEFVESWSRTIGFFYFFISRGFFLKENNQYCYELPELLTNMKLNVFESGAHESWAFEGSNFV